MTVDIGYFFIFIDAMGPPLGFLQATDQVTAMTTSSLADWRVHNTPAGAISPAMMSS